MANQPNGIVRFWQELKRRKVMKVIVIYASTSFILLQLVSILIEPLHLPQWVMTFFVVFLVVGFPIAVIFSWIFDVTPEGIKVTKAISSDESDGTKTASVSRKKAYISNGIIAVLLIAVAVLAYPKIFKRDKASDINPKLEKSIAVLPFIDDSPEEGNAYIVNGLMEEILNKLEKIKELKVVSRTTAEKYRDSKLSAKEIAEELNVNYILEGSGLKVGNRIKIMLQLIEAKSDRHLWSNPYQREVNNENIFELQEDVALSVATELQTLITPEEKERITKKPTDNLTAYDYYLKGIEMFRGNKIDNWKEAIVYFEKALEHDNEFALAFAYQAITYFNLGQSVVDDIQEKGRYSTQINNNADKALLYSPLSDWSLVAKASYYMNEEEYYLAVPYLEKALEYNPNSSLAVMNLIQIYSRYLADYEKSLEYILLAIKNNMPSVLSGYYEVSEKYFDYFILARNYVDLGFFEEAIESFNKCLEINPDFGRAEVEKVLLDAQQSRNYQLLKKQSLELIQKDTANIPDAYKLLGFSCYMLRDFNSARFNYEKYFELLETMFGEESRLYVYQMESDKLAVISSKLGDSENSSAYINSFIEYLNIHERAKENYHLCGVFSLKGNAKEAIEQMRLVADQNISFYQIQSFKDDPIFDNIRSLPDYQEILSKMETQFWNDHKRIKTSLKEKRLL